MQTPHLAATLLVLGVLAFAGGLSSAKGQTTCDPPSPERNTPGAPLLAVSEGRLAGAVVDGDRMKRRLVLSHQAETTAPTTYGLGVMGGGKGNDGPGTQGPWTRGRGSLACPDAVVSPRDATTPRQLRHSWRVNEDLLLAVDPTRRPQVGNSAWGAMLSRYAEPYGPRTSPDADRARRCVAPRGSPPRDAPSQTPSGPIRALLSTGPHPGRGQTRPGGPGGKPPHETACRGGALRGGRPTRGQAGAFHACRTALGLASDRQ